MKEPWIRVVKKAELGKRETLILRLEAIVLALRILYPADWAESICHLSDDCNRSAAKRDGDTGDGQNHDSTFNCVAGRDAGI